MSEPHASLRALIEVMARLRDPSGGCPWDLEQTFATIAPYTIEEAYEVADAIEGGDADRLRDELGDLLFQVVFHARMAQEKGWFDFDDVAAAIVQKLIRRHPHVFGDARIVDASDQSRQWEEHKERERAEAARRRGAGHSEVLADVPKALPALKRASKLGKRAARVGFDWPNATGVREKVDEELRELDEVLRRPGAGGRADRVEASAAQDAADRPRGPPEAAPSAEVVEEFGDLLFALVNWGRHLRIDPEEALRAANSKFERRFGRMEQLARSRGLELRSLSAAEWDALWNESKRMPEEGSSAPGKL